MFDQPVFWVALVLVAAVWRLLDDSAMRARVVLVDVASIVVIGKALSLSPWNWLTVVAGLAWYLAALRVLARARRGVGAALLACAPLLGVWTIGKGVAMSGMPGVLLFVGLSFLLVKAFTLAKDVADARQTPPPPELTVAYLLFFPTFVAGPMHLFGEFARDARQPLPVRGDDVPGLAFRFVLGLVKIRILTPLLKPFSLLAVVGTGRVPARSLIVGAFVYSLVILLDFSGYTDVAITTSRVVGIGVPENFRWPYLAANIREFWQRWHITFTRVLTTYLFNPMSRFLQRRELGRTTIVVVAYGATFLFCGFWHGNGLNFLVWGLYHAAGLSLYDVYRNRLGRAALSPQAAPTPFRARRLAAVAVTFIFVSLGWILFVLPLPQLVASLS